jgi:hypothetical protein
MRKYSLTKTVLQTRWLGDGLIESSDGSIFKSFETEPLSLGLFEEGLDGPSSDSFFQNHLSFFLGFQTSLTGKLFCSEQMLITKSPD